MIADSLINLMCLLNRNNCYVYIVGGAVRDYLLGRVAIDIDMVTDAMPERVEHILASSGYGVLECDIALGTVKLELGGYLLEIVTFRREYYHEKSRVPKIVFTQDIYAEVFRRDFTINALLMDVHGDIIDLVDGIRHLREKRLVPLGLAVYRFAQDALRIFRLARFAAVLGFTYSRELCIDARDVLTYTQHLFSGVVAKELDKMLGGRYAYKGLIFFVRCGLYKVKCRDAIILFADLSKLDFADWRVICRCTGSEDILRYLKLDSFYSIEIE